MSEGNKSKAAELLKIKRSTLGDRLKKLGLVAAHAGKDVEPGANERLGKGGPS
jgi:DNA-binding NtrC family response regulator